MAVRLIAIDIDGTLLDSRWQVPDANREAIARAVAAGIEVALVTGRRFDFARPIADLLSCPLTLIVNNGAVIKSQDGVTRLRHLLPREVGLAVLAATLEFRAGTAVVFDRPREGQIIYEQIDWEDPGRKSYFERNREFIAQVSPLEACLTEDPIQVMYSGPVGRMREVEAVLRAMPARDPFSLAVTLYEARNFGLVDVIRQGCSKGAALAEWARVRGLTPAEVMAIGDNLNDREMLEYAGVPVVMGNSVPELKQLGWRETLTNDEGGVAAAIEAYALNAQS
jgi:Cof subfamily protein (haloacid dehalogenase superfamily)